MLMNASGRYRNPKRMAALVAIACALVVAVAIFALTEQAPETTSAESGFVNNLLVGLFGDIPGIYDAKSELWFGIHIRHWAHTVEFGLLGLFVSIAALLATKKGSLALPALASIGICAICSLVDQCHKLFVPGRHFDWFDLVMDAAGYISATVIVIVVAAIVLAVKRGGGNDSPQ